MVSAVALTSAQIEEIRSHARPDPKPAPTVQAPPIAAPRTRAAPAPMPALLSHADRLRWLSTTVDRLMAESEELADVYRRVDERATEVAMQTAVSIREHRLHGLAVRADALLVETMSHTYSPAAERGSDHVVSTPEPPAPPTPTHPASMRSRPRSRSPHLPRRSAGGSASPLRTPPASPLRRPSGFRGSPPAASAPHREPATAHGHAMG